ncbi:MAG: hypothetical protein JXR94_21200 [Candidatus Hydrogenedentes bacterium]|nr:hypothetical protein [Candidatus Hydrogenedentota bacterium]
MRQRAGFVLILAGLVWCGAAVAGSPAGELLGYVPGDVEMALGINLESLTRHRAFDRLHHTLDTAEFDALCEAIDAYAGVNLLRDVRGFVLAGDLEEGGKGLVLLKGTWYQENLIGLVASNPEYAEQMYAGIPVHVWRDENSGKMSHAAFLARDVLAISEWPELLRQAIDASAAASQALASRAGALNADVDAFLIAWRPSAADSALAQNPALGRLRSAVIELRAGDSDALLSAQGQAEDAHNAQLLADLVRGAVAMAQLHLADAGPLWQVATEARGAQIEASVRVPIESILAAVGEFRPAAVR